jgi:hypothetical protein
MAYTLPELGYAYDALEPHFDAMTMEIHHSKHHQTYVNNLNAALKDHELSSLSVDDLVQQMDKIPSDKRAVVRNQGGGHANHSFFWKNLKIGTTLTGDLEAAIKEAFGNVEDFKAQFEKAAATVRTGVHPRVENPLTPSSGVWLRVGMGGVSKRAAQDRDDCEPGLALDGRNYLRHKRLSHHRARCVGACVLPEVPEPSTRLHQGFLGSSQLG